jgi:hypothetical protein
MADDATNNIQSLHKQWRSGDAAAGQAMAQVFTDWCFAITCARLGDRAGQEPWRRACHAFAQGVRDLGRNVDIVDWAHEIVRKEVEAAGGRAEAGDQPSSLTGNRAPSALLQQAAVEMLPVHVRLLSMTYGGQTDMAELVKTAEDLGGWPFAVLDARYALKRWLRDQGKVPLTVVPASPNLDRGPLPLYEAARMESPDEELFFEKWLITDMDLCRDLAEFSAFTHAMRTGAMTPPKPAPVPAPVVAPAAPPPRPTLIGASEAVEPAAPDRPPARHTWIATVAVLGVLVLVVLLLVYFLDT